MLTSGSREMATVSTAWVRRSSISLIGDSPMSRRVFKTAVSAAERSFFEPLPTFASSRRLACNSYAKHPRLTERGIDSRQIVVELALSSIHVVLGDRDSDIIGISASSDE